MTKLNPEELDLQVAHARSQLAELEATFTREKAQVESVHAGLFRLLRHHYQKRDRLRLAVDYRQSFLDSFVRDDPDEVELAEKDLQQAKAQLDANYENLAAAADKKQPLTAEQEIELSKHWQKLVKLYHPGQSPADPESPEAFQELTAAINQAKHTGNTETLRKIAEDTDFLQREQEPETLRHLLQTLQKATADASESLLELRASPDYELCERVKKNSGTLSDLAAERTKQLEAEILELEKQAEQLAEEIQKLSKPA